jgi:hypothetical protein
LALVGNAADSAHVRIALLEDWFNRFDLNQSLERLVDTRIEPLVQSDFFAVSSRMKVALLTL